jgi:hypothetical protein
MTAAKFELLMSMKESLSLSEHETKDEETLRDEVTLEVEPQKLICVVHSSRFLLFS